MRHGGIFGAGLRRVALGCAVCRVFAVAVFARSEKSKKSKKAKQLNVQLLRSDEAGRYDAAVAPGTRMLAIYEEALGAQRADVAQLINYPGTLHRCARMCPA
ncbi:MAG TPA: hypothetical protein VGB05_02760 [Pyrinomonadaceae bacterium]|jgi:hydroxypyruvate isomerase